MTTELFIIAYVPLALLLIANAWLFVLNYRWHKLLETKVDSLITKIDQGMAGILELDAD